MTKMIPVKYYIVADVIEDYIDDGKDVIMELTLRSRHSIYNIYN